MNDEEGKSVEQRLAELEQYINEMPKSGTPIPSDTHVGVIVRLAIPEMLVIGVSLFVLIFLAVLIGKKFCRSRPRSHHSGLSSD